MQTFLVIAIRSSASRSLSHPLIFFILLSNDDLKTNSPDKLSLQEFDNILQNGNRSDAGESVPPQGLFLSEVQYPYITTSPKQISNLQFIK